MSFSAYNKNTKNGEKEYICRNCFLNQKELKYNIILNDVENAGYTLITQESEYKNGKTYIEYICPIHGTHSMKASNFHNGKRCPDCFRDKIKAIYRFTPDEVYNKIAAMGGELLNKDEYKNNQTKNLKIICPRCHKNILITSLKHFMQHGGQSCSECYRKESIGERKIREWLENNNLYFIQEKWFPDCRDINPLPFDFYLPDYNLVIEFDGQQHFTETHFFTHINNNYDNSATTYIQYHDQIKTNYCLTHNIDLLRIPYTKINNIEKILDERIIA